MSRTNLLPFPILCPRPDDCLRCGYALEGIPAPGRCPECGLEFEGENSSFQITGVARSSGGPAWRKFVWIAIAVVGILYSQLFVLVLIDMPLIALIVFLALMSSTIAMAVTNKQKKRGSEHFAFTTAGFSRWPIDADPSARAFTDWAGDRRAIVLKRVGSVWSLLKVVEFDQEGKRRILLHTGFRCPQEDLGVVELILDRLVRGDPVGEVDGLSSSVLVREERAM